MPKNLEELNEAHTGRTDLQRYRVFSNPFPISTFMDWVKNLKQSVDGGKSTNTGKGVYIDDGKGLQNMVELRIQEQARAF